MNATVKILVTFIIKEAEIDLDVRMIFSINEAAELLMETGLSLHVQRCIARRRLPVWDRD